MTLLDHNGRQIDRRALTSEIARATIGSVRSPVTGYPADGLTPARLSAILRAADMGEPVQYLELLEFAEERDPHYAGVMGTRRRSVSQLPLGVEAFSDAPAHEAAAEEVRGWLKRGVVGRALFDVLDCLPKGFSFSEIIWENPGGRWRPGRIVRRDPRWFRFDRGDLETPLMLADHGGEVPLPPAKFVFARIGAKSGLPLRSGLGRIALWSYLFKKFTERDWQIFIQTYGQPLRLGKFGAGASEQDKETLFRAVANIAGDCAAIVPESMQIEFVQTGQLTATGELYERRSDWIDKQVSKLVLGQTATTDAVTGGLGSGKEHRQVQEDIETADATELAAILTEQLIHPWLRLAGGDPDAAPRFTLARPEEEDLKALGDALGPFIDRGLRVPEKWARDKFGVPEPKGDEAVLGPSGAGNPGVDDGVVAPPAPDRAIKDESGEFKRVKARGQGETAVGAKGAPRAKPRAVALSAELPDYEDGAADALAARLAAEADPAVGALIGQVEAMVAAAGSLGELRELLTAGFPAIDASALAEAVALGLLGAHLAGRVEVLDEDGAGA